jgi:hypothetical protein
MVWTTLKKSIQGVKRMGGKWGGNLPFVMVLVDVFVDKFVVKETVDPVYTGVGEHDEAHDAEQDVTPV